jgi:hypothetical protein
VDYDLKVEGAYASGHATLTVDVLKEGWVQVPIPAGLLVREARLDGKLLALSAGRGPGAPLSALLSRPGRSVLALEVVLPVVSVAGEEKLVLPVSSAGITHAAVLMARNGMDLRMAGGVLAAESATEGGTTWEAYGHSNELMMFAWHRKRTEAPPQALPARFRGSLTELVGLGEDATSVYGEVSAEVVQGALAQVRVAIPQTITVNQVLGGSVGDWEVKDGVLAVHLLAPEEKSTRFMIAGETRLPREGAVPIPVLRLLDADREEGGVAAEVIGAGEMKDVKAAGLESADASALGALVASRQSPSLAAFRFLPRAADRSLEVNVVRYAQQAVLTANVEEARYRALMGKDGKALVEARYAVRNSQRPFVKIGLPAGAVLWTASLAGKPVRPGRAPDGGMLLPLPKMASGEEAPVQVEVLYLLRGSALEERGRADLPLPALDLPVSKTGVMLFYPPGFRMSVESGPFRIQRYEEAGSTAGVGGVVAAENSAASFNAAQQDLLQQFNSNAAGAYNQALVDRFRARPLSTRAKAAPLVVRFPALGSSLFLASELTGENAAPVIQMSYQKERKGGVK